MQDQNYHPPCHHCIDKTLLFVKCKPTYHQNVTFSFCPPHPPVALPSNYFTPLLLLPSSGIGSQYNSNSVLGSGQNHPALRGSQQLYHQHHQYANYNNNNNNNSSGRLSANGSQSQQYTTSSSPGSHRSGGNYLQQQQQQTDNYSGQQTSRGFLGSSSSSSGRNQQQHQTPTSRRENLSHLDNSRLPGLPFRQGVSGKNTCLTMMKMLAMKKSKKLFRWTASLTGKQHNSTPVLGRSAPLFPRPTTSPFFTQPNFLFSHLFHSAQPGLYLIHLNSQACYQMFG